MNNAGVYVYRCRVTILILFVNVKYSMSVVTVFAFDIKNQLIGLDFMRK